MAEVLSVKYEAGHAQMPLVGAQLERLWQRCVPGVFPLTCRFGFLIYCVCLSSCFEPCPQNNEEATGIPAVNEERRIFLGIP